MSIKCTWSPIATHKSGRPVAQGEIARYELAMQVEGAPDFSVVAPSIDPAATEYTLDVTDPGLYNFELRGVDSAGVKGDPAKGSIKIADTSGLSAPQNFVVVLQ